MVGPEAFTEVKYLAARQADAGARPDPGDRGASSRARSGATPAGWCAATAAEDAETIVVALGSVLGTIEDAVDELRDQGVSSRRRSASSASGPFPLEEVRAALGHAKRVVVLEKALRRRRRRDRRPERAPGALGHRARTVYDGVAGLGGRPITKRSLHALLADALEDRLAGRSPSSTWTGSSSSASSSGPGRGAAGPARREHPARHRNRRRAAALRRSHAMPYQRAQVLPGRHLRGRQPPARSRERSVQARDGALEHAHLRPSRLPGLRRGARRALRARRGDARDRRAADRGQRDRLPGGLLDALTRSRPGSFRGSTRCSATPRRSRPGSPRR